jgi:hypothetical protein
MCVSARPGGATVGIDGRLPAKFAVGRETAEAFRREAENAARTTEAVVGRRMLGLNCLW